MAHKVHPRSFRIHETGNWQSRWMNVKHMPQLLEEDFRIRAFLEKRFKDSSLEGVEIERSSGKITVIINTARPGLVIGRGGSGIEEVRNSLRKLLGIKNKKTEIRLEIREIRNPWASASLCAQWVASQLEHRMPHRRTLRQVVEKMMANKEVQGAKVEISGRLGGAEIGRREKLRKGKLPLQTLRSEIDYAQAEAQTTYGTIGVKVWMYRGEKV